MAFVLVIVGLLMIVTGAKGTYAQFGAQVGKDFTGPQPFTYWIAALGAVGAVGYIDALRVPSRMFMALILIAMVLANRGFFAQFTAALKSGPTAPPVTANAAPGASSGAGNSSANGVPSTGVSPQSIWKGMQNGPDPNSLEGKFENWIFGGVKSGASNFWNWLNK